MLIAVALAILFAFTAQNLVAHEKIKDRPTEIWKLDLESRRIRMHEILTRRMPEEFDVSPTNSSCRKWNVDRFIDNYLAEFKYHYRAPDNWTIHNLIENNEHALFRPYVFEDALKKYEIEVGDDDDTKTGWTFKDFIEKYEPTAVMEQVKEEITGDRNVTKGLVCIVDNLDSTDELLSLTVQGEKSGRRWRAGWWHPQPYQAKLNATDENENVLLYMKQSIYEARDRMGVMQVMREEFRKTALYRMGYLFAKIDHAVKIFSSLSYKSFRTCSMIRQKPFGAWRLYFHYLDIIYSIERLLERWFDVDILKDLLISNDVLARKVILKDRNFTTEMVIKAFDEMFIE